ncbi:MAG: right-handed parallel beta-helix repeat-containing protein, partial [Deltaproteobacteria bacterium]|nr:right-handed parallel beta-helix repeat-containing protein [Deltaproteobacteria bacterium]
GTGEGMYLGCNAGACSFRNGIIANNFVHDTGGAQGDGIEVKEGAFGNDIRDNVIVRTPYPGITMYGYASQDPQNIVERNVVWHTMDNGIQIVGQIIVRNNIVLGAAASGIASKPSQTYLPHDALIQNNTIVGTASCLKTNNWTGQLGNTIVNNALYCPSSIDATGGAGAATILANVGTGTSNAASGFTMGQGTDLANAAMADVWPPPGSALLGAADMAHQAADDFNATMRTHQTVGAYDGGAAMNPGWTVMEGFKPLPPTPPPMTDAPPFVDCPTAGATCPNMKPAGCCETGGGDPSGLLVLLSWWSARQTFRYRRRRARSSPR